jgi:hypothetical protein
MRARATITGMVVGAGIFIACNTLPLFGPPLACLAGELANGALEDPILLITGCAGLTIEALIQAVELEIANLAGDTDASVDVAPAPVASDASSDGAAMVQSSQPSATQAYKAHLQRILARAKAIQADGGAK